MDTQHVQDDLTNQVTTNIRMGANCVPPANKFLSLKDLELTITQASWCWNGLLASGMATLLISEPGVGKSLLSLRIAGCVTNGFSNIDGSQWTGGTGKVLLLDHEAGTSLYIERAKRLGIDTDKIVTLVKDPHDIDIPDLKSEETYDRIIENLRKGDYKLIIVDSLSGGSSGIDENSTNMGLAVKRLAAIAAEFNVVVLIVHHLNKAKWGASAKRPSLDGVRGSSAIVQYVRVVVSLDCPVEDSQEIRLCVLKNNISQERKVLSYRYQGNSFFSTDLALLERLAKSTASENSRTTHSPKHANARELIMKGTPVKEIVEQTQLSKATVYRLQQDVRNNIHSQLSVSSGEIDSETSHDYAEEDEHYDDNRPHNDSIDEVELYDDSERGSAVSG